MKKRVGIILNSSWNLVNFRLSLILQLCKTYDVFTVSPIDEYTIILSKNNVEHIPLKHLNRKGTNPIKDLLLYKELKKIYTKEKPDIVLHYTIKPVIYGTLAAKSLKIPSISTITGLGSLFITQGKMSKVAEKLYEISLKRSTCVFFQNKDDQALFVKKKTIKPNTTHVINGSGVDSSHFDPDKNFVFKDKLHFLFIGRLLKDKGIYEFVAAANKMLSKNSQQKFTVMGDADFDNPSSVTKSHLNSWKKNSNIHFLGYRSNVKEIISGVDVVVLPSYREGVPRSLLEAAAMAKPIICTDVPGCREVVIHKHNGILVQAKNTQSLYKALCDVSAMSKIDLKKYGDNGRERVLKIFDIKIVNDTYEKKIRELIIENK